MPLRYRIMIETFDMDSKIIESYTLHGHERVEDYFGKDGKPNAMLSSILRKGMLKVDRGAAMIITREWEK